MTDALAVHTISDPSAVCPVLSPAEYKQVVKDSIYAKSGEECYTNVHQAFADAEQLLEHPMGWRSLTSSFP